MCDGRDSGRKCCVRKHEHTVLLMTMLKQTALVQGLTLVDDVHSHTTIVPMVLVYNKRSCKIYIINGTQPESAHLVHQEWDPPAP